MDRTTQQNYDHRNPLFKPGVCFSGWFTSLGILHKDGSDRQWQLLAATSVGSCHCWISGTKFIKPYLITKYLTENGWVSNLELDRVGQFECHANQASAPVY
jgi:hypothetical protein